jgi:hypothetical protein
VPVDRTGAHRQVAEPGELRGDEAPHDARVDVDLAVVHLHRPGPPAGLARAHPAAR